MTIDLRSTLERLYALIPQGKRLGLERMQAACARFGNPERSFTSVHVAGTNGKGTVCAFVSSMARSAGLRVGTYTSPHLHRFAERIAIDGAPIEDDLLVSVLNRVMDAATDLTFFEVATLAAFLAFKEAGVQLAVLEVGLGGRLDATNVIPPPRVAAITRVAFDHMAELGDTLGKIAFEKAGIIKPGSAVVLGKLHPEARAVIEPRVAEVGARLVALGSPEPIAGAPLAYPRIALLGSNLAVAVTIGRELGWAPEVLAQGVENTVWPGRNELLHRNGQDLTLLDCAHNPDGAVALSHALDPTVLAEVESRREIALVFGALSTKNWRAMLRRLEQVAGQRIYVAAPISKAVDPREMLAVSNGEVAASVEQALTRARELVGPKGVVVVAGSTFLVGAARALLLNLPTDPPVAL
ncbi:MAG TPA: folylpolyglutamate synthase/dihydrofolate synthase family protein [Polyangiaceae bacterium]|nr:folylpolyglutamate synthase/dihydrofolate synthase family protein [Polyangiaceae bacterium]